MARLTAEAKRHLENSKKNGVDFHACPKCGRLLECEAMVPLENPKHWVNCPEHGQQVGVGSYYFKIT